jgi:uncharacterized protein YqeY
MSLLKKIDEDLIKALKGGDKDKVTTLRGLKSDVKYRQIEKRPDKLTDDDIIGVLSSAAKRRRDSIEQFESGGRDDLVARETRELEIIKKYLPRELSPGEIESLAREAITEAEASVPSDIGRVMKIIMPKVKGKADGKIIKETVTRLLSS